MAIAGTRSLPTRSGAWRFLLVGLLITMAPSAARAQLCVQPPNFGIAGASCPPQRQSEPCACSETLQWTAVDTADWYEIRRCDASDSECAIVGDTRWRNRDAWVDEDGRFHAPTLPTFWLPPWDRDFPRPGFVYAYSVRACRDGLGGVLCSTSWSPAVLYAAAPYMCIENGLEVSCLRSTADWPPIGDADGDGIPDRDDPDDDNDGVVDGSDRCAAVANPGQRDGDGDGIGDACDLCPRVADPRQEDTDLDGIGDLCDVCPLVDDPSQRDRDRDGHGDACDLCPTIPDPDQLDTDADELGDACDNCPRTDNPDQTDTDRDGDGNACDDDDDDDGHGDAWDNCPLIVNGDQSDRDRDGRGDRCDNCRDIANADQADGDQDLVGDICDNCVASPNPSQADRDGDGRGDRCDDADGLIYVDPLGTDRIAWQAERGPATWNVYIGDLAELRATGVYTPSPGSDTLAERFCGLVEPWVDDPVVPAALTVKYVLVTGVEGAREWSLGEDSEGHTRPNDDPCP